MRCGFEITSVSSIRGNKKTAASSTHTKEDSIVFLWPSAANVIQYTPHHLSSAALHTQYTHARILVMECAHEARHSLMQNTR